MPRGIATPHRTECKSIVGLPSISMSPITRTNHSLRENTRRESAYRWKHSYLVSIIYTYKDVCTAIQIGQVNGIEMLPRILTGFQGLHDLGDRQWVALRTSGFATLIKWFIHFINSLDKSKPLRHDVL